MAVVVMVSRVAVSLGTMGLPTPKSTPVFTVTVCPLVCRNLQAAFSSMTTSNFSVTLSALLGTWVLLQSEGSLQLPVRVLDTWAVAKTCTNNKMELRKIIFITVGIYEVCLVE